MKLAIIQEIAKEERRTKKWSLQMLERLHLSKKKNSKLSQTYYRWDKFHISLIFHSHPIFTTFYNSKEKKFSTTNQV